jgi:hypothetical protein
MLQNDALLNAPIPCQIYLVNSMMSYSMQCEQLVEACKKACKLLPRTWAIMQCHTEETKVRE